VRQASSVARPAPAASRHTARSCSRSPDTARSNVGEVTADFSSRPLWFTRHAHSGRTQPGVNHDHHSQRPRFSYHEGNVTRFDASVSAMQKTSPAPGVDVLAYISALSNIGATGAELRAALADHTVPDDFDGIAAALNAV
jgi:hypothetical protein